MASMYQRGKNSFLIQFVDKHDRKRGISLSNTTKKNALHVKMHVEAINAAAKSGHIPNDATSEWLGTIGDALAKKLAKVGLIEPRNIATIGEFVESYLKGRTDWKPGTKKKHNVAKDYLFEFFPKQRPLRDITEADADAFARFLKEKACIKSEATRAKHVSNVRAYFRAAVRQRLIKDNPFDNLQISKAGNGKKHFVTIEETKAILEACPNVQWRMVFALSRFGGVRMVSEIQLLEWDHILWDQGKILIHSPKTEHHPGKDKRLVPLFPELREYLAEGLELAPPNTKYVIDIGRKGKTISAAYIRGRMATIIQRAGIVPWPKLFNSCRSTRETELEKKFSIFTVCAWLGNSPKTFQSNYHQITEDDFAEAASEAITPEPANKEQAITASKDTHQEVMPSVMQKATEILGDDEKEQLVLLATFLDSLDNSHDFLRLPNAPGIRSGLEPDPRPYHGRMPPKHLQTVRRLSPNSAHESRAKKVAGPGVAPDKPGL